MPTNRELAESNKELRKRARDAELQASKVAGRLREQNRFEAHQREVALASALQFRATRAGSQSESTIVTGAKVFLTFLQGE